MIPTWQKGEIVLEDGYLARWIFLVLETPSPPDSEWVKCLILATDCQYGNPVEDAFFVRPGEVTSISRRHDPRINPHRAITQEEAVELMLTMQV